MNGLDEVKCWRCGEHICWMTYSGPTGLHFCDSCAENEREYDDNESEDIDT